MPDHLIALRCGRLRDAFNLDAGAHLAGLKGLFRDLIMRQQFAPIATGVPVEPGPIIARALQALFIAPPAALRDPLRQHIHDLRVFGLVVEEVFGKPHEHHRAVLCDLHRLDKRLHLARLHSEIHHGTDRDDEHRGEEAGKAKPQRRMPVR